MRKFNIRWWIDLPKFELHSHVCGVLVEGICFDCMAGVPTVPTVVKWHGFSWDEIEPKMLRLSE